MDTRRVRENRQIKQVKAPGYTRRQRGTALLEAALVMPLLILLLLGTLEVGRMLNAQHIISQAAGAGGRQASLGTQTNVQVRQAIIDFLREAKISTTNATITVTNMTHPGVDASQALQLDKFEIYVSVPVADITWTGTSFLVERNAIVGSRCQWVCACGQTYPTDITVPPGF